tara:strand:- start:117 stop:647 length:531 start_codon:yes stop_codon:yes gene_type:complete
MSDLQYPPNPAVFLRILADNHASNPDYLINAPYSDEDIDFLSALLAGKTSESVPDDHLVFGAHADKYATISDQAMSLYNEMATFRASADFKSASVAERNSLLRTMTSLLEKLVSIDERAKGLRYISDFQNTMLEIIEDVMSPDQRTQIMDRLRAVKQDAPRENELADIEKATNDNE